MGSKQSVVEGTHSEHKTQFIHKIFEERLNENNVNRTAIIYHDTDGIRKTSFDALNRTANRLAACILEMLRDMDADRNADDDYVIAVCMNPNDNVIVTLLAIWKTGAAYLPLDTNIPINRTESIVNEAKPALVICDHNLDRNVFQNVNTISFDELLFKSTHCSEDNIHTQHSVSRGEDDVAIILYTSESSGKSKGVRIPHSAVLNKLRWLKLTFPYSVSESVAAFNSLVTNVDSVAEIWSPLLNGVSVLVVPPKVSNDPLKLVDLLEIYKIERLAVVPTFLTSILEHLSTLRQARLPRLLTNLKTWMCCGETLTASLAEKFFKYFSDGTFRLCNFYGSTEVMGNVTYYVCENFKQLEGLSKVPIGFVIDNTVIFIMNDDLSPVKPGEIGEIFVAGLNLAKGYVAGKGKSKFIHNRFTDNSKFDRLYRTGDFGRLLTEGCIQYEGRADSQMKVQGNRLEIVDIEMVLKYIDEVDEAVVLCYHTGKEDQALLAFVIPKKDFVGSPSQQAEEIETTLRIRLQDFEVPRVCIIESIPILPNGKIDRQMLLNHYENCTKIGVKLTAETNVLAGDIKYDFTGIPDDQLMTAKEVFEIIGNVIGVPVNAPISVQSNFLELGGDSLKSILTVAQLNDKGYSIGVIDFIAAKCLGDVLAKICNEETVNENLTKFRTIPLSMYHKHQVISILTSTFYDKSHLGVYLMERADNSDNKEFVEQMWEYILEKDLSFAVTDREGNIVGINLNKDGQDPPKITMTNSLNVILEFLDSIEKPVLEKLMPQGKNKVFHCFVMATSAKLSPQENIEAIQKMEEVNVDMARRKGFVGILATNTHSLTQQLGSSLNKYRTLVDCQINNYAQRNGTRPFGKASDSVKVLVQWKNIIEFSG